MEIKLIYYAMQYKNHNIISIFLSNSIKWKKKLYTFKLKNGIVCVEWPEEGAFNDILIKGWKLQPLKFVDNYRCNAMQLIGLKATELPVDSMIVVEQLQKLCVNAVVCRRHHISHKTWSI